MTIYNLQPRDLYNSSYSFLAHKTSKYEKLGWDACHTLTAYQFLSPCKTIIHGWDNHSLIFFKKVKTCQVQ